MFLMPGAPRWPVEMRDRFAELWARRPEISMQTIARILGTSKSACSGMRRRMGLPDRGRRNVKRAPARALPKGAPAQVRVAGMPAPQKPPVEPRSSARLASLAAPRRRCSYPVVDDVRATVRAGKDPFCGAKSVPGKDYCADHARRMYRTVQLPAKGVRT